MKIHSHILGSLGISAASFALAVGSTSAYAGEAAAKAVQLEEVVVTAQFREEKLQDTPISITAFSGAMLEARSQTNITEITNAAPNVTLTPTGSGFGNSASASIRGVGQYDFNFGLEPGVGMYIDDVYYGVLFGSVFDLTDLDRVEVLRGPQGTLAGKNSIGGSIKLFSKKPTGDGGGYVEVGAGNFNQLNLRAGGDLTLVPGKLFARVSAVSSRRKGYFTRFDYSCASSRVRPDCVVGTEGGKNLIGGRLALRWVASDTVEDNLIFDRTDDSSEVQATKLISQGPWAGTANYVTAPESYSSYSTFIGYPGTINAFTIPPVNTMSGWGVSNNLDIKLGDNMSLKYIAAWRRAGGEFSQDIDASPVDVETIYNIVSHEQKSHELRLSGLVNKAVEWTVGGYYYTATQTIGGRKDIPAGVSLGGGLGALPTPPFPNGSRVVLLDFTDDDTIKSKSTSAFAHLVFHPVEDLSIIAGVRYTKDEKSYRFTRNTLGLPGRAPLSGVQLGTPGGPFDLTLVDGKTGVYSGTNTDYRLGVNYRWSPSVMAYANYSTGYKGGGSNPRPFNGSQLNPFGPEKLNAFEVGAKTDFLDGRGRLNVAAFMNKYKDIQLTALACPAAPCALPINAGDADVKGAELELTLKPTDGWLIDATASFLSFKYTRITTQAGTPAVGATPASGVQPGMITPFTPERKFNLGVQYEFKGVASGSITPRLDISHQSEYFGNAVNAPENRVEWPTLVNARISWADADNTWNAALAVTNLTDKFYYINKFALAGPPFFVATGQPARPREVLFSIKRNF
jgi:iron complex outermembrane recepter protein